MKKTIKSFIIIGFLMWTGNLSAQSSELNDIIAEATQVMKEGGYRLLDAGGFSANSDQPLVTDLRTYYDGRTYIFYGLVEDCESCSLGIKFGRPGDVPAHLSERNSTIERFEGPNNITLIYNMTEFEGSSEGYWILTNKSNKKRYMYGMLFVKE